MENEIIEEIIDFEELRERHKNVEFEELCKLVLVCKNCGHKDLLIKFLKEKENRKNYREKDKEDRESYPWNPKPHPSPWNPSRKDNYYSKCNEMKDVKKNIICAISLGKMSIITSSIGNDKYEKYFYCPKCGSSLVVLDKEFTKNNIGRVM